MAENEAPAPQRWWAVLDAHDVLLGWSADPVEGAPSFDHQPDNAPGRYRWDAARGAFVPLAKHSRRDASGTLEIEGLGLRALAFLIAHRADRGETLPPECTAFAAAWARSIDCTPTERARLMTLLRSPTRGG